MRTRLSLIAALLSSPACDLSPLPYDAGNTMPDAQATSSSSPDAAGRMDAAISSDEAGFTNVPELDAAAGDTSSDAQEDSAIEPADASLDGGVEAADAAQDAETTHDATVVPADASVPTTRLLVGVNTHNYPKPSSYGFVAADGKDRMGSALTDVGVDYVRGATIGDVDFLNRLASYGVKHVLLGLNANSYGKPFDRQKLRTALGQSFAEVIRLGLDARVEGLNEWDLFNSKDYNAGVLPTGTSASEFVTLTQKALYEEAHMLSMVVLGPSVGHPQDQSALDFFPDVSPYVDIVNMHLYFGTQPETLPIADRVRSHQAFQGSGKPIWITETGVSAYAGVSVEQQADIIGRGLATFAGSGLINAAFLYELLDGNQPGLSGLTYTPDGGELHFGLFTYGGAEKPAVTAVKTYLSEP